jgi:hypothetical protein
MEVPTGDTGIFMPVWRNQQACLSQSLLLEEDEQFDSEEARERRKKPRPRDPSKVGRAKWVRDPTLSPYMVYLTNPNVDQPGTILADEFCRKFRLPKKLFDVILKDTRASGVFPDELSQHKRKGHKPFPLAIKVLACLRQLALGSVVVGVQDASCINRETLDQFFHRWVKWFVTQYYDKWVSIPSTAEELHGVQRVFQGVGLPGCCSSMDGVHLAWDKCPAALRP